MSDKWNDHFETLGDFIQCLNKPSNASGSLGRVSASAIIDLQSKLDRIEAHINSYDTAKGSAWDLECGLIEILKGED